MKKKMSVGKACAFLSVFFLFHEQVRSQATNKVDTVGNIGIGTLSPEGILDVNGSTSYFGSNGSNPKIRLRGSNNSYSEISTNTGVSTNYNGLLLTNNANGIGGLGSWTIDIGGSDYFSYSNTNTLSFRSGSSEKMRINSSGYVGIGTTNPVYTLDVNGQARVGQLSINSYISSAANRRTFFQGDASATNDDIIFDMSRSGGNYGSFQYVVAGTPRLFISGNYLSGNSFIMPATNFGIGTTSPSEKLSVNGNISAKKIIVTQLGWSDYVFGKDYKLKSLSSLESFIRENKHLPEVPSAKEVEEKGISIGDTQALLLKKIEELTLYVIAQEKRINAFEKKLKKVNK